MFIEDIISLCLKSLHKWYNSMHLENSGKFQTKKQNFQTQNNDVT